MWGGGVPYAVPLDVPWATRQETTLPSMTVATRPLLLLSLGTGWGE